MAKRAVDLIGSLAGLTVASPALLGASLAIVIESRGSPIYSQERVGKDGRQFKLYKLRTMVAGAEHIGAGLAVNEGDPRITRVGAFLRRLSLDELPNLVNVLKGEMSLVGPRPTVPVQVAQYSERQLARLRVKPGITGWAQVNGRASLPWEERIELDLWYVKHRSLWLDLKILMRTVRMLATGKGLYKGDTGGWLTGSKDRQGATDSGSSVGADSGSSVGADSGSSVGADSGSSVGADSGSSVGADQESS